MERVINRTKGLRYKPSLTTPMEWRRTIGGMEKKSFQIGPAEGPSPPERWEGPWLPERDA